jgi:hypothetical protein
VKQARENRSQLTPFVGIPPRRVLSHPVTLLLIGAWSVVLVGLDLKLSQSRYAFTSDSAVYVEYARHLSTGRGFPRAYPWEASQAGREPELNGTFPPGYGLLIGLLAPVSGGEPAAAVVASRLSAFLVPIALVVGFNGFLPRRSLLAIAAMVAISPGMIVGQFRALADFPYLLLAITSSALCCRATRPRTALVAGVIAGCGYWLRIVGAALLVSVPVAYTLLMVAYKDERRFWRRQGVGWLAGALSVTALLLIVNSKQFGAIQPYKMPSSTVPLTVNLVTYARAQAIDIVGGNAFWRHVAGEPGRSRGQSASGMTLIVLSVGLVAFCLCRIIWTDAREGNPEQEGGRQRQVALVCLLLSYVAFGGAIVVVGRTRYEWGELITSRHALQYSWALLLCAGVVASWKRGVLGAVLVSMLSVSLAVKGYDLWVRVSSNEIERSRTVAGDRLLLRTVIDTAEDSLILSDHPVVLRIETFRTAYLLGAATRTPSDVRALFCERLSMSDPPSTALLAVDHEGIRPCRMDEWQSLPFLNSRVLRTQTSCVVWGPLSVAGCQTK